MIILTTRVCLLLLIMALIRKQAFHHRSHLTFLSLHMGPVFSNLDFPPFSLLSHFPILLFSSPAFLHLCLAFSFAPDIIILSCFIIHKNTKLHLFFNIANDWLTISILLILLVWLMHPCVRQNFYSAFSSDKEKIPGLDDGERIAVLTQYCVWQTTRCPSVGHLLTAKSVLSIRMYASWEEEKHNDDWWRIHTLYEIFYYSSAKL